MQNFNLIQKYYLDYKKNYKNSLYFFRFIQRLKNIKDFSKIKNLYYSKSLFLNNDNLSSLAKFVNKSKIYPPEYLLNEFFFYNDFFYIKKPVFITRNCTEYFIQFYFFLNKIIDLKQIIEFGCGSGSILSIISKNKKNLKIYGVDIDKNAILVSKQNVKKYKNTKIILNDWTNNLKFKNKFQFILANPPYVISQNDLISKNKYESKLSLFGNKNSVLNYYYDVLLFSISNLVINGWIIFEISIKIFLMLKNIILIYFFQYYDFWIKKDNLNQILFLIFRKKIN